MAGIRKKTWTTSKGVEKTAWEITYYVNGKRHSKGGFNTKKDAQKALNDVVGTIDSDIQFGKLAEDYIARHCAMHCKESTRDLYEAYLKVNLKDIKNIKICNIKTRDINDMILGWRAAGMKNKSINNIMVFTQAVFNYGIDNEIIGTNPCAKIKKLPLERKEMHFMNETEVQLFLEKAKTISPDYSALFHTALFTGMRRGELLALEWGDIDFAKKTISINKQLYRGRIQPTKTTKSDRKINISTGLVEVLKQHKKESKILSKIVFCNHVGCYIHPYNMSERYFKPVLRAVAEDLNENGITNNLEKVRFHDLRHTYASVLLSKNVPVKYVQKQLGHSSSRITLDTYAHVMPSTHEQAVEVLDALQSKTGTEWEHEKVKTQ